MVLKKYLSWDKEILAFEKDTDKKINVIKMLGTVVGMDYASPAKKTAKIVKKINNNIKKK